MLVDKTSGLEARAGVTVGLHTHRGSTSLAAAGSAIIVSNTSQVPGERAPGANAASTDRRLLRKTQSIIGLIGPIGGARCQTRIERAVSTPE